MGMVSFYFCDAARDAGATVVSGVPVAQILPGEGVILEGGDIVFVPRAAQIFVTGQAARPAAFKYVDGMTVQDALQLAGGISDRGSIKRLKIVRFEAGKRKEVKAELTDLLKPGDTVNVGERFF
jgi:hypothetical protein